ncbi:MAG: ABC transporter permease, partial [Candidatus Gracilibacteria bacterium]|nr:ABC transporter permease [Candidatus Gracilibacteria bacterium]
MFKNNPIFFKDLLITLNSKQGKIIVFFFMFIYFLAFLLFLSEIKSDYNFYETSGIGKELFMTAGITQLLVLTGISFFRGLQSFTVEKSNKTLDFIKISPISSTKFVLGKFLSSISFILLLFLISIPFLSVGLVLGGVNLSDILIYCLYTFSYTSFAVLLGMFISSLSKNTIFSILYGFISIPALIFFIVFFLGYTTDYFEFNNFFRNGSKSIFFTIIPVTIFTYIPEKDTIINFFGLNIHYLFYHFAFFGIINYFLFTYINKKYKEFSDLKIKTFSYFETFLLILLFSIFSGVFSTAIFGLVFSFLIFIYLFYIFNNSKYGIYKYI